MCYLGAHSDAPVKNFIDMAGARMGDVNPRTSGSWFTPARDTETPRLC